MPIQRRFCFIPLVVLLASLCHGQTLPHQQAPAPQAPPPPHDMSAAPVGDDDARERISAALQKKWNKERQMAIQKDSDKLLELAEELKTGVEKSSENVLAVDVIKKAEEIEKLAHSVKEKMKGPN